MAKKIVVIGANGQLGKSIQAFVSKNTSSNNEFIFCSRAEIDITKFAETEKSLEELQPNYILNCSAYTAVDKAESEVEQANLINHLAVEHLAKCATKIKATLIHISTDFVFDGSINSPLNETMHCQPLGAYGQTKYDGEVAIAKNCEQYFILRTSWLYSNIGANFFTNISKYAKERAALNIVYDQVGTPTYTMDLVDVIFKIIDTNCTAFGIYHFSNEGVCSWYDFAFELVNMQQIECNIQPILSVQYPTPAKRPAYSVLDKAKIKKVLGIEIPHWRTSLELVIANK